MTTYATLETSVARGRPVELYAFAIGTTTWRYTTAAEAVVYDGDTYTPAAMTRSAIEDTDQVDKARLTVSVPFGTPILNLFVASAPAEVVSATVFRGHVGAGDFVTIWKGRVISVSFEGDETASLTCESVFTSLRRTGLRRVYQTTCGHILFGAACAVSKATYEVAYEVTGVTGAVLTVPSATVHAEAYFAGGYAEYTDSETGALARRYIVANSGSSISVASFPFGLTAGDTVKFYPGCDHTVATCAAKFSNYDNYGGMPFIPVDGNPFDGKRVF